MHLVEFKDTLHGWCEAGGYIYRTTDGGFTWTAPVTQSIGPSAISMADTLNGWAVGNSSPAGGPWDGTIMHTTDGGKNWVDQRFAHQRQFYGVCARSKERVTVAGISKTLAIRDTGKIVSSTSGGQLWIERTHADTITALGKIQFVDSLHGWMNGFYINTQDQSEHPGFLRTIDGGGSWGLVKQVIYNFSFVDSINGFAFGGRNTGGNNDGIYLLRTHNGGFTWDYSFIPDTIVGGDGVFINAISFIDTVSGWLFGETFYQGNAREIIIRTTDGGKTWTRESIGLTDMITDATMIDAYHGWTVALDGRVMGYGLISAVIEHPPQLPLGYILRQNYPNPFNNSTTIEYAIPKESHVHVVVYDETGKLIATLVNEYQFSGIYRVQFDATQISSGIYYYTIQTELFSNTKKLILLK